METTPFTVTLSLEGWALAWARLDASGCDSAALARARSRTAATARARFADPAAVAAHPATAALRRLFRAAGCDPTRYRPSSEALLRRLVKGDQLPAIQPLVDVNNCLSAELAVPCCVMRVDCVGQHLELRAGRPGESYVSLKGPFSLEGKPLLVDERGPLDTPITGNERVKVEADTVRAWLVSYLPAGVVTPDEAWAATEALADASGLAAIRCAAEKPGS